MMKPAIDVIREFQNGDDGWDDNTMLILLADYIDHHGLNDSLAAFLKSKTSEVQQ